MKNQEHKAGYAVSPEYFSSSNVENYARSTLPERRHLEHT